MLPPHELRNKTFTKSLRGYNPVEVDEYVDFLIEKYTELYRENDELERKFKAAITRLDEIKEDEDSIRSTLIDAKRAANKIKADATERAEMIIKSAKESCNSILADLNDKIELGRATVADLQRDAFELKQELFARYSEHITFIEKLTEGMDESAIPPQSELRREAIKRLKANITGVGTDGIDSDTNDAEDVNVEDAIDSLVTVPTIEADDDGLEPLDIITTASYNGETLEISRDQLSAQKGSLRGSVEELNRRYKETEEIINTPDSDIADEESYQDFIKSVTGKSAANASKDDDFDMLFSNGQNQKKKKD